MTKEEAGNSRAHYTNSLRFFRSFAQKSKPNMLPTLFSPCSKKRAQVTIFVIITVLLVAGIVAFFVFQDSLFGSDIPRNMRPVYDAYLDCVEDIGRDGVYLMGQQGGYIDTPEFSPGSAYRPFSSHLDFFGQGVPYWMYVSGNNIMKEQIPTKAMMTEQLETYIEERLDLCNFREYELQGYSVYIEEGREGSVDVRIEDSKVEVTSSNPMNIYFGNDSVRVNEHSVAIDVRLGALYDQAKELYNYERTDAFLEKYAIDVLRLYAPVDGVELQCTPIIFDDFEIRQNLTQGLVANMNFLKVRGSYYELSREENEYFVVNPGFSVDTNVNFMYDPSWPTRIEIHGERIAKPVGLQEGLSILGFCYVPYHLVYDVNFPVLVQFWEDDFFFQFPLAVVVEKNTAREALPPLSGYEVNLDSEVCKVRSSRMSIYTYDSNLNPVPARLQFKCLTTQCEIGQTELSAGSAIFDGNVPACLNGVVIATAEGYAQAEYQVSTNEQAFADIILKKKYTQKLDLGNIDGHAVVSFVGQEYATTVLYPDTQDIELIEDFYNVTVHVYKESTITLDGYENTKCVEAPVDGVGSLFGLTEEKCFDLNVPSLEVESALIGGGRTQEFITEDILQRSQELNINVPMFFEPTKVEDLQANFILADDSPVYINFA